MRSIGFCFVTILFIGLAAFGIPVMVRFNKFCKHVASKTERIAEYESTRSVDDGGLNAFQREQFWALLTGNYKKLSAPDLIEEGRVLSYQFRLSYLLGIALIALTALVDLTTR